MLSPKRTKFRKYHRGRMNGKVFLWIIKFKRIYTFTVFLVYLSVHFINNLKKNIIICKIK